VRTHGSTAEIAELTEMIVPRGVLTLRLIIEKRAVPTNRDCPFPYPNRWCTAT